MQNCQYIVESTSKVNELHRTAFNMQVDQIQVHCIYLASVATIAKIHIDRSYVSCATSSRILHPTDTIEPRWNYETLVVFKLSLLTSRYSLCSFSAHIRNLFRKRELTVSGAAVHSTYLEIHVRLAAVDNLAAVSVCQFHFQLLSGMCTPCSQLAMSLYTQTKKKHNNFKFQ